MLEFNAACRYGRLIGSEDFAMAHTIMSRLGPLAASLFGAVTSASAVDFELANGVRGSFDSTYTVGGALRTQGRNPGLIGLVNGGRAFSINGDNGNLNFSAGDFVSLRASGVNELQLEVGNLSLFTRVNYFYDAAWTSKKPSSRRFKSPATRS
jgi:hypothetical protein